MGACSTPLECFGQHKTGCPALNPIPSADPDPRCQKCQAFIYPHEDPRDTLVYDNEQPYHRSCLRDRRPKEEAPATSSVPSRVVVLQGDVFSGPTTAKVQNLWKVEHLFMRCNTITGEWFPQLTMKCIEAPGDPRLVGHTVEYEWEKLRNLLDTGILVYVRST